MPADFFSFFALCTPTPKFLPTKRHIKNFHFTLPHLLFDSSSTVVYLFEDWEKFNGIFIPQPEEGRMRKNVLFHMLKWILLQSIEWPQNLRLNDHHRDRFLTCTDSRSRGCNNWIAGKNFHKWLLAGQSSSSLDWLRQKCFECHVHETRGEIGEPDSRLRHMLGVRMMNCQPSLEQGLLGSGFDTRMKVVSLVSRRSRLSCLMTW